MSRPTRGSNVRRKFKKHMVVFDAEGGSEGGSSSYDNESVRDQEVTLMY